MAIPKGQLLRAVNNIERVVDGERDRRWRRGIARAVNIDQRPRQAHQLARRRGVLPATHRRLARQANRSFGTFS